MTARPHRTASAGSVASGENGTGLLAVADDVPAASAAPPPSLTVTVPALVGRVREVRLAARRFAERHGVERPDDVALAIAEACVNVVVHAYAESEPGDLRVTGSRDGAHVRFVVIDDGAGLIPRPNSPGLGLGLPLIAQLADEFEVSDGDGRGTRVRMAFTVADPAARTA